MDYLPETGIYENVATDVSCQFIFLCLKRAMDYVQFLELDYYPWARNSNSTVAFGLRSCGLPIKLPYGVHAPQFDEDIYDDFASGDYLEDFIRDAVSFDPDRQEGDIHINPYILD